MDNELNSGKHKTREMRDMWRIYIWDDDITPHLEKENPNAARSWRILNLVQFLFYLDIFLGFTLPMGLMGAYTVLQYQEPTPYYLEEWGVNSIPILVISAIVLYPIYGFFAASCASLLKDKIIPRRGPIGRMLVNPGLGEWRRQQEDALRIKYGLKK